jgi:opacity protein-like surface antigen
MKKTVIAFGIAASFAAAGAHAQTTQFSIEPRAGLSIPVGDTGEDVHVGLALTGDVIFQATPQLAVYAGYNHNRFAFKDSDDADAVIKGFDAGVRFSLSPMSGFTPFVKAGVLFQKEEISDGLGSLEGDNQLGFQAGAGVDVPISPRLSFTPQASFNVVEDVQYVNVEAGLRIRL